MAWMECSVVRQREEFVKLAMHDRANISQLCKRFGISRKTGYKWLDRQRRCKAMSDLSRRPLRSPRRSEAAVEAAALAVRERHPAWGGRKIRHVLIRERLPQVAQVPAASTITQILR